MIKKIFTILLLVFCFFNLAGSASAEKINSYDVSVLAHKDGKMSVTEIINYDFEYAQRHGIYRYIPLYSKVGDLYRVIKIDNAQVARDGESEKFEISKNNEQIYFKIGNGNKTITGAHIYKISYTVENGIGSNFPEHDEIYWNATGNDWPGEIERSSIKFNTDFGENSTNIICFTGNIGSKDNNCIAKDNGVIATQVLYPGTGLTAVATYQKGTFPESVLVKNPPLGVGDKIISFIQSHVSYVWFILNITAPGLLFIWYFLQKNKKRYGPPVVNFDTPRDEKGERISPALAGTIDTAKLDRDDVVATIFDLAIRKYFRLEEIKTERKLLPDSVDQKIIKLKEADGNLNSFEMKLFLSIFKDEDNEVMVSSLKSDFYQTFEELGEEIFRILVAKNYYTRNPKLQKSILIFLAACSLFTTNIILALTLFFISIKVNGRTILGDEIDHKIDGLKLFLKAMDRNYKWQTEKFYTVEQMIPYAMSLGYIDKFMKQLEVINPNYSPTWYSGYHGNFFVSYTAFASSIGSNLVPPSASGGGGGGFSGGGGGGGGGGSW